MANSRILVLRKVIPWLLADACVVAGSVFLAMIARSVTAEVVIRRSIVFAVIAVLLFGGANYVFQIHQRMWRYASSGEMFSIAGSVAVGTFVLSIVNFALPGGQLVPSSVALMTGALVFVGLVGVRYRRRVWTGLEWRIRAMGGQFPVVSTRVLLVGAGEAGQLLAWRLRHQKGEEGYEIVGFVDDDLTKRGMQIHGILVRGGRHDLPELVALHNIDLVIIAIFNISDADFRSILDICERTSAVIKVLPNVIEEIRVTNGLSPMRDVTAWDLIGRKPIEINLVACRELLAGRVVLVTGAAGTIGSELCRQILAFEPRRVIMLDNNESGLYDLLLLFEADATQRVVPVVGDVTNEHKMLMIFDKYRPAIVFHAAAYKHVPLMEDHPDEAVRVNVLGTRVIARMAQSYGGDRFVLVSTDKAVDPSSVMGITKRLCEIMVGVGLANDGADDTYRATTTGANDNGKEPTGLSSRRPALPTKAHTIFTAVRFGNVLGSRGSVVPTFERQIDRGGPVTVTHPEMTRYFMSISEAASLIIQAATLTEGNDIFMLDMGQEIRIDELARRLIRLRGLRPDIDIPIIYSGVRPGEKLREQLIANSEERFPTAHPHIYRIQCKDGSDRRSTMRQVEQLIDLANHQEDERVVALLHEMVGN